MSFENDMTTSKNVGTQIDNDVDIFRHGTAITRSAHIDFTLTNLIPTDWGGLILQPNVIPIVSTPDDLINIIICLCKSECIRGCGCHQAWLSCSIMCLHCQGAACCIFLMVKIQIYEFTITVFK